MSPLPKESVETSEGSEPDECDATERGDKVVSDLWSKRLSVIRSSKQLSRLVKSTVLLSYYVRSLRALVVLLQGAPRGQIARRVRRHYRECSLTPEEWSMVLNGGRGQAVTLHDVVRLATAAGIRGRCLELVDATRAMGLCANSLLRRLQRGRNKLREEFPEEKALRDLEGEGW